MKAYRSFIFGILLTVLYQSLMMRAQPVSTYINDEHQTNQLNPQFDGDILIEPLKPRIGNDVILWCPIRKLGKYNMHWEYVDKRVILGVQNVVLTQDPRINTTKAWKDNKPYWCLIIKRISMSDVGYYVCQIDTTPPKRLLKFVKIFVPMEFDSNQSFQSDSVIKVKESSNVSLTCKARGNPEPSITWRKQDGLIILDSRSNEEKEFVKSEELYLQEVSRSSNGDYVCIASNGIDNSIRRKVTVQVNFPPTILVPNKVVNAFVNQNTTLECIIESNPRSQILWLNSMEKPIETSPRFFIKTYIANQYKVFFKLIIYNLKIKDSGKYYCLSTNYLGVTRSSINLLVNEEPTTQTNTIESILENETFMYYENTPVSVYNNNKHLVSTNLPQNNSNQIILMNPSFLLFIFLIFFLLFLNNFFVN